MRNIFITFTLGVMVSLLMFFFVKDWEEDARQSAFELRAQAHMATVRKSLEGISKRLEDVRYMIGDAINEDHEDVYQPKEFIDVVAPMLSHESALIDLGWAVASPKVAKQARLIYHLKSGFESVKETNIVMPKQALFGYMHQENNAYELHLITPITNTTSVIYKGRNIAALVSEWDVKTLIEQGLEDTPVSAQDITFFNVLADGKEERIYFHPSRSRTAADKDIHIDISYMHNFNFAGMHWHVVYEAAPKFLKDFPVLLAWQLLVSGLLITLLLTWYLYRRDLREQEVEQLVVERTQDLKRSEDNFSRIVNALQDIYFQTDVEGAIKVVSPSVSMLGYTVEEVLGSNITAYYLEPSQREALLQALQTSANGSVHNYHAQAVHKNGTERWISANAQFMYDIDGKVIGIEGTLRDFTESKLIAERAQHVDRLESLGVLAGGVAHDFNNLLTVILGNIEVVRMEMNDASTFDSSLDSIEKASKSAAGICKQMLAYAGKGNYCLQALDLRHATQGISELIHSALDARIVIEYDFPSDIPLIDGDIGQIQQVVMNIIINAAESYQEEAGVVSVQVGVKEMTALELKSCMESGSLPEGAYVYLQVADQGCGMDKAMLNKIFEPFFTTKFTGRGLGMSAILGIIRSHHGALHITSKLGEGTSIEVYFPVSSST